jgi:DNA repair exonuclease SbcCD ATPase subunit
MRISRLYIENFSCYDNAYIDFNEFSSAILIGKKENNDDVSNGVGKTTIFKAIEYVLFNYSDENLEDLIRDDMDACSVTIDFIVSDQEYRVTRTRTRKGTTDLTLYKRTPSDGEILEVYHSEKNDKQIPLHNKKYWEDISGRRSADTEKDLGKLLKINVKSFRVFVHFVQHDFSGLTTATPEKRKALLREAMNLVIYPKLEKLAKEKLGLISKEIDKFNLMVETLGDPDNVITELNQKIIKTDTDLSEHLLKLGDLEIVKSQFADSINKLINEHAGLEKKFSALLTKEQSLNGEKVRSEISVKEYTTKKANIVLAAKEVLTEIKALEETQLKLVELDFNKIDVLSEQIISNKEEIAKLNLTIQNNTVRFEKIKKPIPADGECEECRQPISPEHRLICQEKLNQEQDTLHIDISNCAAMVMRLKTSNVNSQQEISKLTLSKQHLESVNTKIANKKREVSDKKEQYEEYKTLLDKFIAELSDKNKQLEQVAEELKNSSLDEAKILQKQIQKEKTDLAVLINEANVINKEIAALNSGKAIFQHDLNKKVEDKRKKIDYAKHLKDLEDRAVMYPTVIQSFSSTGIPNLIIQNVLDDLQDESNKLLSQLKPGMQLSFSIEKKIEKTGEQADTLDINYTVNGKKRYYQALSGAMKLAVTFSLKLGLSFLLQKLAGVDIKFLLFDEIDESLDKASTDSFADIVKLLQKEYKVLVISHNDRLKDKFAHAILVEQDTNMVSKAQVVSSW